MLTVDNLGNNRVTQERATREDSGHAKPVTPSGSAVLRDAADVCRPRPGKGDPADTARLELGLREALEGSHAHARVLKGIVTRDDAELAVSHGVDGLIVSNHGGRSEDSGRGAIECLSDVVGGVAVAFP